MGPGAYDAKDEMIKDKVRSYKMGNTKRSDLVSKEQINQPGPGIYD